MRAETNDGDIRRSDNVFGVSMEIMLSSPHLALSNNHLISHNRPALEVATGTTFCGDEEWKYNYLLLYREFTWNPVLLLSLEIMSVMFLIM